MDVFISWSGDFSRQVAVALKDWLPTVLQRVKPWVSDKDIHSGARWQAEVVARLDKCSFGILIVTSDNQQSPWLQFEAGALSKSVADSRVVPLLIDISKSDLLLPLNMFQAEYLDEDGVLALLTALNAGTDDPLPASTLVKLRDTWLPDFLSEVEQIRERTQQERGVAGAGGAPQRSDRELLEEIVTTVRYLRDTSDDEPSSVTSGTRRFAQMMRHEFPTVRFVQTSDGSFQVRLPAGTDHEEARRIVRLGEAFGVDVKVTLKRDGAGDRVLPESAQKPDLAALSRRARRLGHGGSDSDDDEVP